MMKKTLAALSITLLLSISIIGCMDSPTQPPAYNIPKLVIDHAEPEGNTTIIYIHGLEEVKYDNITLKVDNETVEQKFDSFSLEYETNRTEFSLDAYVSHEENRFNFNATLQFSDQEENIYSIEYYDEEIEKLKKDDLPYVERFNQIQEGR